jgi:hypothetical protein
MPLDASAHLELLVIFPLVADYENMQVPSEHMTSSGTNPLTLFLHLA